MTLNDLFLKHGSDKGMYHSYGPVYETFVSRCDRMLEVGVKDGASLRAWQEFFPGAEIWGLDINDFVWPHKIVGDATDSAITKRVPAELDLIVDDGSHKIRDQLMTLALLWPKLRLGGRYVIEDITEIDKFRDIVHIHIHRGHHSSDDNAIVLQRVNNFLLPSGWFVACERNHA